MARLAKYINSIAVLIRHHRTYLLFLLGVLLVYTRFVNLPWGFPNLMHPDENNMMSSVMQLQCDVRNVRDCLNPHFFAYGQFSIYLASALSHLLKSILREPVLSPLHVSLTLRFISAVSSVITGFYLYKFTKKKIRSDWISLLSLFFYVCTPLFIQAAHFGTTESLLMLLLMLTVYYEQAVLLQAFFVGLAVAVKPSGLLFGIVPLLTLVVQFQKRKNIFRFMFRGILAAMIIVITTFIGSPHYFIHFTDFIGTFQYESSVATGAMRVFYTEQFAQTLPIVFQFHRVLPYTIGWGTMLLGVVGMVISLKKYRFHVFVFSLFFLYNSLLYAKWTRFIVPYMPLFIFFAMVSTYTLYVNLKKHTNIVIATIFLLVFSVYQMIIGVAYLSIYQSPDVRTTATNWIIATLPQNKKMLSESANVVDVPLGYTGKYQYYNPFINDIDGNQELRKSVMSALRTTDFLIIPSRRVFADYTCYRSVNYKKTGNIVRTSIYSSHISLDKDCNKTELSYPALHEYYTEVLGNKNAYELLAEFSSYPKLTVLNITLLEFPDELAEETWTVFDHPVIRVYRRVNSGIPL
ncbi:MAG: glycosyltransferase family 39 protein [Patescibacteria group bacterium]|jgi:hypothetical protein